MLAEPDQTVEVLYCVLARDELGCKDDDDGGGEEAEVSLAVDVVCEEDLVAPARELDDGASDDGELLYVLEPAELSEDSSELLAMVVIDWDAFVLLEVADVVPLLVW